MAKAKAKIPSRLPPPTPAERDAIAEARNRVRERRPRFALNTDTMTDKKQRAATHDDHDGWEARMQDAFGTSGRAFAVAEIARLVRAATVRDGKLDQTRFDSLLAVIDGARPANEIEAMLASQIAVTHSLAMDFLLRAKNADQIPQFDSAGRLAAKLLVAFAGHVELLNKLKRGGSQTVCVEHVHVHPGGQAIVGNVSTGGREPEKNERQPHAPDNNQTVAPRCLAAEPSPALSCIDTSRQAVPVPSGEGEEPLPDARRRGG